MSSSISPAAQNEQPSGMWPSWPTILPYMVPPTAASLAIIPVFRHLIVKSAQQKGEPIPKITYLEGIKAGIKAAPTVGIIVGAQMILQSAVEKAIVGDGNKANLPSMLASSAIVGIASAPALAVFNGHTMGWTIVKSLRMFSAKQGLAIAGQETAFVCGLTAADMLSVAMKKRFGDNKAVEYSAAYLAGALGSLAGHPGNTALTRWQSSMTLNSFRQSMWGAARKAHAIGSFSVFYKLGKETLNLVIENSKK